MPNPLDFDVDLEAFTVDGVWRFKFYLALRYVIEIQLCAATILLWCDARCI